MFRQQQDVITSGLKLLDRAVELINGKYPNVNVTGEMKVQHDVPGFNISSVKFEITTFGWDKSYHEIMLKNGDFLDECLPHLSIMAKDKPMKNGDKLIVPFTVEQLQYLVKRYEPTPSITNKM